MKDIAYFINSNSSWKCIDGSSGEISNVGEKIELVPYCGWRAKIIGKNDITITVQYSRNPFWLIVKLWRWLKSWLA